MTLCSLNTQKTEMKMKVTHKIHKLLGVVFAVATIAVGSLALATPSQAYWVGNTWCDTNYGYLHCVRP